ncbi:MAG: hypothetical protein K1X83_10980 [Oligoflexia bacterium]|nr:hypothetical protein [Oligoflexia bacterium]
MEHETLRIKTAKLRRKSQRALGVYRKAERSSGESSKQLQEAQLIEWKSVNETLTLKLSAALEESAQKGLSARLMALRDFFHSHWREAETKAYRRQQELLSAAQNAEYIKAAGLAQELVSLKAREQANRAAYSELQGLVGRTRGTAASAASPDQDRKPASQTQVSNEPLAANVIPLRRRTSQR